MSPGIDPSSGIRDASQHDPFSGAATFTLKHRLERLAFGVAWTVLARWTPAPMHAWRSAVLRAFGAKIGRGCFIYPDIKVWYAANLHMDDAATLGPGVICYSMAKVSIGHKAIVSQRAHLCAGTHSVDDAHFQLMTAPISIGANAWIAAESFVGPGVQVGEGAVLGARAVTVKNLEPWTIYAGNPARQLRERKRSAVT